MLIKVKERDRQRRGLRGAVLQGAPSGSSELAEGAPKAAASTPASETPAGAAQPHPSGSAAVQNQVLPAGARQGRGGGRSNSWKVLHKLAGPRAPLPGSSRAAAPGRSCPSSPAAGRCQRTPRRAPRAPLLRSLVASLHRARSQRSKGNLLASAEEVNSCGKDCAEGGKEGEGGAGLRPRPPPRGRLRAAGRERGAAGAREPGAEPERRERAVRPPARRCRCPCSRRSRRPQHSVCLLLQRAVDRLRGGEARRREEREGMEALGVGPPGGGGEGGGEPSTSTLRRPPAQGRPPAALRRGRGGRGSPAP